MSLSKCKKNVAGIFKKFTKILKHCGTTEINRKKLKTKILQHIKSCETFLCKHVDKTIAGVLKFKKCMVKVKKNCKIYNNNNTCSNIHVSQQLD